MLARRQLSLRLLHWPAHSCFLLLSKRNEAYDEKRQYDRINRPLSVQEIDIDNLTAADGLAVDRASGFVGRAMERLLDGLYTLDDQTMYDMAQEEGIRLEPSALAGMAGPQRVCASTDYRRMHAFSAEQ